MRYKITSPDFSKNIKLSFHATSSINNINKNTNHKLSSGNKTHSKTIYIPQAINNIKDFMIFYDTGYEDMSCKCSAVQHIKGDHDRDIKVQFTLVLLVF